jgi:hypothetical protein
MAARPDGIGHVVVLPREVERPGTQFGVALRCRHRPEMGRAVAIDGVVRGRPSARL